MNAVVKTRQGEVRGRRVDGGHAFKGLPYAAPPFGAHRLAHAKSTAATYMYAAWVAFATSGDPGWPKYDLGRRATMRFDTTLEVVDDPRSVERTLWAGVR